MRKQGRGVSRSRLISARELVSAGLVVARQLEPVWRLNVVLALCVALVLTSIPIPVLAQKVADPGAVAAGDLWLEGEATTGEARITNSVLPEERFARRAVGTVSAAELGEPLPSVDRADPGREAQAAPATGVLVAAGPSLRRPVSSAPPVPGIQHHLKSGSLTASATVRPPESPWNLVAQVPNEYLTGEQLASGSWKARLQVAPAQLLFARTAKGPHPRSQTLVLTSPSGTAIRYAVAAPAPWLEVLAADGSRQGRGRVARQQQVLRVSVLEAALPRGGAQVEGTIVLRNLDNRTDEIQIPVHVLRDAGDGPPLLRSHDDAGRLQRLVRPDGESIDYGYSSQGLLESVRHPDGTQVSFAYDSFGRRVSMTDFRGTTVYRHDKAGRVTEVFSPGLGSFRYAYDGDGNLETLTWPSGEQLHYAWGPDGRLLQAGDSRYTYDGAGRLLHADHPYGVATDYGYDADGRLVEVVHRGAGGEVLAASQLELDEAGRPRVVIRNQGEETTLYDYDKTGRLVQVNGADGRVVSYEYDAEGRRLRRLETGDDGLALTDYEYDAWGRLVRAGDETFHYDANGNLALRLTPDGAVEYTHDGENRLSAVDDGRHRVEFAYDGDGHRVAVTVDGQRTDFVYDGSGFVDRPLLERTATGERRLVYGLEMLRLGEGDDPVLLLEGGLPESGPGLWPLAAVGTGGEWLARYDAGPFGEPHWQGDGESYLASYRSWDGVSGLLYVGGRYYDPELGQFLTQPAFSQQEPEAGSQQEPGFQQESETGPWRWPAGSLELGATDALSARRAAALGQGPPPPAAVPEAEDAAETQQRAFQTLSNQLPDRLWAANGKAASPKRGTPRPFPSLDQFQRGRKYLRPAIGPLKNTAPKLALHPEYLSFAETAAGLVVDSQSVEIGSTTDQTVSFTVSEDIPWLSLDATGGSAGAQPLSIQATLDAAGLDAAGSPYTGLITVTNTADPDDVRTVGVRVVVIDGIATTGLQSFDSQGNLQRRIKADGSVIDYEWDGQGRLLAVRYPDGSEVAYTYDQNGNRVTMVDPRGTTVYQYDTKNRLRAVFHPGINPVRYEYDRGDNLTRLTYPDGSEVLYTYDADERLVAVREGAGETNYEYDASSGNLVRRTLPNGVLTTYTHDADGRLLRLEHRAAGGALLVAFQTTYNANGLKSDVQRELPSGVDSVTYEYDDKLRLTRVSHPDGRQIDYTFDELGNRLSKVEQTGAQTSETLYTYNEQGQLVAAGEEIFQYDANGNVIRRASPTASTRYEYDFENRLIRVDDGQRMVEFEYDGDGNRTAKIVDNVATRYVNEVASALTQPLLEADGEWRLRKAYLYGVGRLASRLEQAPQWNFYLGDGKSVVGQLDAGGALPQIYDYAPFGEPLFATGPAHDFLYDGEQYDVETGLIFLRSRYYDPTLGRFLSQDRFSGWLHLPDSVNPYTFANNNPVNFADPSGDVLPAILLGAGLGVGLEYAGDVWKNYQDGASGWGLLQPRDNWAARYGSAALVGGLTAGTTATLFTKVPALASLLSKTTGLGEKLGSGFAGTLGGIAGKFLGGQLLKKPVSTVIKSGINFLKDTFDSFFGGGGGEQSSLQFDGSYSSSTTLSTSWQIQTSYGQSLAGGDLGGVYLNKTAELMLQIDDLAGATYDEATGQLVLYGEQDISLPEMDLDDLAVAVHSVFNGEDPGVSIDPPIVNGQWSVRYEGQTASTEFGYVMFEADRVLKSLMLGKDNLTGQPVAVNVPGYRSMLSRRLSAGCKGVPDSTRMWFQPKEVRLVRSTDGRSMVFDAVSMQLLYESKVGSQVVADPQAAAFAAHLTDHFDAYAAQFPILKDMERLGKIVGVIKWIKDNDIPIDLSFIDAYGIEFFSTPVTTPNITVQGTSGGCQITLQGGVTYTPPNEYIPDDPGDPMADALRDAALGSRPAETDFLWTFPSTLARHQKGGGQLTAIAQSFARSRKDGNTRFQEVDLSLPIAGAFPLELVRYYDSFADQPGAFGPGWHALPIALRFPVGRETFTFGPDNQVFELHARVWVGEREAEREDAYELLGIDSEGLPLYLRSGAMDLLRQRADGTFQLRKTDGSQRLFAAAGRPLEITDPSGNTTVYGYDGGGHLASIEGPGGRRISLELDAQGRIAGATGPGGRQLLYSYDSAGRLASVTQPGGGVRTYAYDADDHLTDITDAEGQSVYAAGYDDYHRSTGRRVGTAATYGLNFDLEEGRTTVVDPLGGEIRRLFDEKYRLREQRDPLGNRLRLAYDGDFGPSEVTDARGATTRLAYDVRGNLTTVVDAEGGTVELYYDFRDRLVAMRDAEGVETAYGYDDDNRLTTLYQTVQLQFDGDGNLTGFLYDPNDLTRFAYGPDGSLVAATDPLDRQAQFSYDATGQLATATTPSGVRTDFTYDGRSRLTSAATGPTQVDLVYNEADQLTQLTTATGSLGFAYDLEGQLTRLSDAEGHETEFTYDGDGNLTSVRDPALETTSYSYDVLGNLRRVDLPNGTANAYETDELSRPVVTFKGLGTGTPRLALVRDDLDFGSVAVGQEASLSLGLFNLGRKPLTVTAITAPAPFGTDLVGPAVVPPGEVLTVLVTFAPTASGPADLQLTVNSDDPESSQRFVGLLGEGVRKVTNLTATPRPDGIQLDWDLFDTGGQPFAHFNIYRSTTAIAGDVSGLTPLDSSLTDASTTSYRDRSAAAGARYHYAVTPVFAGGLETTAVDAVGPVAYFTSFGPVGPETTLADDPRDERRPALAWRGSGAGEYLMVYELDTGGGGGNLDVYGQRLALDGTPLGSPFAIASSLQHEQRPRVAYNSVDGNYLVVYEFDFNGDGSNFVILGQRVSATGTKLGSNFFVGGFNLHERSPELVYHPGLNQYLVAFEMDGNGDGVVDTVGRRVSGAGTLVGSAFFLGSILVGGLPVFTGNPHLALNSARGEYMVIYEVDLAGDGSDYSVLGQRFDATGVGVGGLFTVANTFVNGSAVSDRNPYLAYDSGHNEFLAVWEQDTDGDGSDFNVFSQKLTADGVFTGILSGFLGLGGGLGQDRNARQVYNPVADEHLIVWEEDVSGTERILARRLRLTSSSLLLGSVLEVAAGSDQRQRPDAVYGGTLGEILVAWEHEEGGSDVHGRLLGNENPQLELDPEALDFGNATGQLDLTLTNTGTGRLDWLASTAQPWLTVAPESGSATMTATLTVTVDRSGLAPGSYGGTVTLVTSGGTADVPVSLTVDNRPPVAPHDPLPASGATGVTAPNGSLALPLSWQAEDPDGDSLSFDLYLADDPTLVDALNPSSRVAQGLAATSFVAGGLDFLTTYHWRVVAIDSRGGSTPGPRWSFTSAAVAPPILVEWLPDPTRDPRPVLRWQAAPGAASYDLELADEPTFSAPLLVVPGLAGTSFQPGTDLPEDTLHWRVRSVDAGGRPGPFSAADSFTADRTPAAVPVLTAVEPDPLANPRPALNWTAVAGADAYHLQVALNGDFAVPFLDRQVAGARFEPAIDLPEGDVSWRLASLDPAGNESPFSVADSFLLDLTAPPAVTGLSASRGGSLTEPVEPLAGEVMLTWDPLAGPPADFDHFNVYRSDEPFSNVSGRTPLDSSLRDAAAVGFVDAAASAGQSYYYAVTAVDGVGNENKAVTTTFIPANLPPAMPSSPSPAHGSAGQSGGDGSPDVDLGWQAQDPDGGSLRYDVYLSTEPARVEALDITVRAALGLEMAAWTPDGLGFATEYHWRVVALDDQGASTPGPVWSFTTLAASAPALTELLPDPGNQPQPTFEWQAVPGAVRYEIAVDDDPAFASPEIHDDTLTSTQFPAPAPLAEGLYHWRVRLLDSRDQPGPFSPVDSFEVDLTAPAVPTLTAVAPDPTNEPRPLLDWNDVAGSAEYHLQVASEDSFISPIVDLWLTESSYLPQVDLPEGAIFWRVAGRDTAGNESAFSPADGFLVDRTAIPAVSGLVAIWNGDEVQLSWDALAGPPADFARFHIYRESAPFGDVSLLTPLDSSLADPSATGFVDPSADPALLYHYAVTAVDLAGNENPLVTSAATPPANIAPTLTLVEPDGSGDEADWSFEVAWQDEDPDSNAAITLFYDTDASGGDGTLITGGLAEDGDGAADVHLWDTTALPAGSYWVYAVIDDGIAPPQTVYSAGPVTVDHSLQGFGNAGLAEAAWPLLAARTAAPRAGFFIYHDMDSALNRASHVTSYGAVGKVHLEDACLDDPTDARGCSSDPGRLDRTRGTVLRVAFDPLSSGEFAGVSLELAGEGGVPGTGQSYDLSGANNLVLSLRNPTTAPLRVQLGLGGSTWPYQEILPSVDYAELTLPLADLDPTPDLSSVHILLQVQTNDIEAPGGGILLLDDVRLEPAPLGAQATKGLPLSLENFGVLPVDAPAPGRVPVPPDQVARNLATVYEASLAVQALLARGTGPEREAARQLVDALDYALDHDNSGLPLPPAPDGATGLRSGYQGGALALVNGEGPGGGQAGEARLAGFSGGPDLCGAGGYCLVQAGATGGNNALALLALLAAFEQFGDVRYLEAARTLARWVAGNLRDDAAGGFGGYFLGYGDSDPSLRVEAKSTENNADLFAAFTALAWTEHRQGNGPGRDLWRQHARHAGDFVLAMFDASDGCFHAGTQPADPPGGPETVDNRRFIDASTFSTLALAEAPRYREGLDWRRPVQCARALFEQEIAAGGHTFQGFGLEPAATAGPEGVAWEFTAQLVAAMRAVDRRYGETAFASDAEFFLSRLHLARLAAPFGDGQGLVASTLEGGDLLAPGEQCLSTSFQCIPQRVGLAATLWGLFADRDTNPLATDGALVLEDGFESGGLAAWTQVVVGP